MRTSWLGVLGLVALVASGCGCSEKSSGPCPEPGPECCLTDDDCTGPDYMECCLVTHECFVLPDDPGEEDDGCEPGYTCDSLLDVELVQGETAEEGCFVDWSCCEARPDLSPGKIGTHLGMDVATDGTIWLSGYAAGPDESHTYGDLAAGIWDGATATTDWELIDGVPWDEPPYAPPTGFRGGINVPGDDVGLYGNLALDGSDAPRIAYHDATGGALRFVTRDGGDWNDPVIVDDDGMAGTYASMQLLSGGVPAVAYRAETVVMEDYAGAAYQVGTVHTVLRYAVATDPTGTTWTVTDVASAVAPCFGAVCPEDTRCRIADGLCWPEDTDQCSGTTCAAEEACLEDIDGTGVPLGTWGCDDALSPEPVYDLPEGIAIWNSLALAPDGSPEVVYYDRTHGELHHVSYNGTAWEAPVILDGDDLSADPADHGDKGWNPSLTIDSSGTRHIAYVDGLAEALMYIELDADGAEVVREVVDDGTWGGTTEREIVGDYSAVVVDGDGRVRLAYQNTTSGLVMMAVRGAASGAWTISVISDPGAGFMGYYINHVLVGATSYVGQFTFNYEIEPYYRSPGVLTCTVATDDSVSCI